MCPINAGTSFRAPNFEHINFQPGFPGRRLHLSLVGYCTQNEFQRICYAVFGGDDPGRFGVGSAWTTAAGTLMDCKPPFCRAALEKKRGTDQSPRHRKIKRGAEAKFLTAFSRPQCRALLPDTSSCLGRRTMRVTYLKTKQVELLRILFSIGLTAFVGVGTFMIIRYVFGLSE